MQPPPGTPTDEELMSMLCAATDRHCADSAFRQVFERYHTRVVAWCYRISKNRESARDLAQEVFLKAYRHRHSFRGDAHLSTWLFAIARNHCLTALRKAEGEAQALDPMVSAGLKDSKCPAPDRLAEQNEMAGRLLRVMTRILEPMEVRVMTLHYAHDVSLAAITQDLGLRNPSGAKAYIVNARRKLFGAMRRRGWQVVLAEKHEAAWWKTKAAA